jgi:hypothetical protein
MPELRQAQYRLVDAAREHVEGDKLAQGELAVHDELCPEIKREC